MILLLLLLRLKQLIRILLELGFLRSIILVVIIGFFLLNLTSIVNQKPWILVLGLIGAIFSNHIARKDKDFLFKIAHRPWLVYLVEYGIIALPFLFFLIRSECWVELLIICFSFVVIPFIGNMLQWGTKVSGNSFSFFPLLSFEWRSGLRREGILLILVYMIAIIFAKYSSTIPIALLLLAIINTTFYLECEPRQMVELYGLSSHEFLKSKIFNQLLLYWVPCTPLIWIFLIVFPEFWYVDLIMILVCSVIQILAIMLKYSSYIPKERLGMNSLIIALSVVCFMVPFLSPIPIILIIRNYRKAINTLKEYLYAYH